MTDPRKVSSLPPWVVASSLALGLGLAASNASAQENGTIRGVVAEDASWRLIESAKVSVVDTEIETETGPDGTFLITGLPLGKALVRIQAEGFPTVVEEVDVTPDGVPLPVFLQSAMAALEEILVFGKRASPVNARAAKTAADLVAEEVPSIRPVLARATESRNAPVTFSIRGRNSLGNASAEPLIVVDGLRLDGGIGNAIRVLRQIPAHDVTSLQVLKGASSAFLYGAANGVIIIETQARPNDR
jgi:TonB-dependent SusC/RagA subfamily outer membrane receptor